MKGRNSFGHHNQSHHQELRQCQLSVHVQALPSKLNFQSQQFAVQHLPVAAQALA